MRLILSKYPIVALTGPRQSGKTTFLKQQLSDYRYVNLEHPDNRAYALEDTKGFLAEYDNKVIFDEVQRVPKLFSYLQVLVDEKNTMGQFILSGSQNFNLMANITQSLAGRVSVLKLLPFDFSEMKKAKIMPKDYAQIFTQGCYPAIYDRKVDADRYYADYIKTYVQRDVSQLLNVQNAATFTRFIKLCATRAGQLVNYNDLARDAGVSHTTVRNWLSVLETSYILFFLQPYYKNYSKRLIKSPKLYFYDVGLLSHLLNIRKGNINPTHSMWGNIFENMIVVEKVKQNEHQSQLRDYYFWRDSHGKEVDLLYPEAEKLHTYEIKASSSIKAEMFKGLDNFDKISNGEVKNKTLIYGGNDNQKRTHYNVRAWGDTD